MPLGGGCALRDPLPGGGGGDDTAVLTAALPERLAGEYTHRGTKVTFDAVKLDQVSRLTVWTALGDELYRFEETPDAITITVLNGRCSMRIDTAGYRDAIARQVSTPGLVRYDGDQQAFQALLTMPEYAVLPYLSRALGRQGHSGRVTPAALPLHVAAMHAARELKIEMLADQPRVTAGEEAYCTDMRDYQYTPGATNLGMCGPGWGCWDWVCGDCCCHQGCYAHDKSCRNCHWYTPWSCLACATFATFWTGGQCNACATDFYLPSESCKESRWVQFQCVTNDECCGHWDGSTEAGPSQETAVCGYLPSGIKGGKWCFLTMVPSPSTWGDYRGCFTDDGNRALDAYLGGNYDIGGCVAAAAAAGYAYAGLQYYGQCFAGNSLGYNQVGDGECNTPCYANPGQICGGSWRNSIFATGATPPPPPTGAMQANSAIRNCTGYSETYIGGRGSAQECYDSCAGYEAVEWYQDGQCYCEHGTGCQVIGGFSGWWAGLRTGTTEPPPPTDPPPAGDDSHLGADQRLYPNQSVTSNDGRFRMVYQGDGNLVLYYGSTPLWASNTSGTSAGFTVMQGDGNLVVYNAAGAAVWNSQTHGNPGAWLQVQDDGNATVRGLNAVVLWATHTCCH